jgi:hypothetical protein
VILSTYVVKGSEDKSPLELAESRSAQVMDTGSPFLHVSFKPKAFAKDTIALAFDDRGQIVSLSRQEGATAPEVSQAIADAVVSAPKQYLESLETLGKIQAAQRTVDQNSITSQIEELQKQKQLVDTRLALAGATENSDLVLQQEHLKAQLATLESQLALATAQSDFDQKLEIAKLKTDLDRVQQELALLQAQLALEQQKNK